MHEDWNTKATLAKPAALFHLTHPQWMPEQSDGNPQIPYLSNQFYLMDIFEEKEFINIDLSEKGLPKGEYEDCRFNQCNLSKLDLSGYIFINCSFEGCDISLIKLQNTILRDVQFKDCKMIGLQFGDTNEFGLSVSFDGCILTNASFYKTKIKKTKFKNSKITEVDFTEADLTESIFDHCDLTGAIFSSTNVEKVDFTSSYNYTINPEENKIKKSKHSQNQLGGLLTKYDIKIG